MTYVELIVVLGIFAIISSTTMFNYGSFQSKVDIKNLTSDIALKLVQAQKYSTSGKLPPLKQQVLLSDINTWKPSYGVYFNTISEVNKKKFVYFTDVNSNNICDATCTNFFASGEFLEKIDINKGNYISKLEIIDSNNSVCATLITGLTVLFRRPNSEAIITTEPSSTCVISHMQITVSSPSSTSVTSKILVYPSGRVEIK
ncbi:MAG: type II secretion system protein [Patescibacteria group bacterium]